MTSDPREAVRYRIAAAHLKVGDLVDTGDEDWQQVIGVYDRAKSAGDADVRALVESVAGQYIVAQLTSIAPVDSDVYFSDGVAMVYGDDDNEDRPAAEAVSQEDGVRTYLYTKFELVTVRASA